MTKSKGRVRSNRGLVEMGGDQAEPSPRREEDSLEDTAVYPTYSCIDGYEAQVVVRTDRGVQSGKLLDFAVSLVVRREGCDEGWSDVERVDCTHGFVHVDQYSPGGSKSKSDNIVPPQVRDDLDAALRWATEYIWDIEERTMGWE